jgi:hypothetical protein
MIAGPCSVAPGSSVARLKMGHALSSPVALSRRPGLFYDPTRAARGAVMRIVMSSGLA